MRAFAVILAAGLSALSGSHARLALPNPVTQSLVTIGDVAAKLQRQCDDENKVQTAFTQWCDTVMLQSQREEKEETLRREEQLFPDAENYLDSVRSVCQRQQSEYDHMSFVFKKASNTASHLADFLSRLSKGERSSNGFTVFTQTSGGTLSSDTRNTQKLFGALPVVLNMVQRLAQVQRSAEISQLAGRLSTTIHSGGEDSMSRVRKLIQGSITNLEAQADIERSEQAMCDEEMAMAKMVHAQGANTSKARAGAVQQVESELSAELASAASSQAKVKVIRSESHKLYLKVKDELQQGLAGIQTVAGTLQKYYNAHDQPDDAFLQRDSGNTYVDVITKARHKQRILLFDMIEMLQMAVEQVSTSLDSLDEATQVNCQNLSILSKDSQDAKEVTLRRAQHELGQESSTAEGYRARSNPNCVRKASSFEEREAQREKEIAGLQEALAHLHEETF